MAGSPSPLLNFTLWWRLCSGQPPASGPAEAGADVTLVRAGLDEDGVGRIGNLDKDVLWPSAATSPGV